MESSFWHFGDEVAGQAGQFWWLRHVGKAAEAIFCGREAESAVITTHSKQLELAQPARAIGAAFLPTLFWQ